jgi:hypothetical protein
VTCSPIVVGVGESTQLELSLQNLDIAWPISNAPEGLTAKLVLLRHGLNTNGPAQTLSSVMDAGLCSFLEHNKNNQAIAKMCRIEGLTSCSVELVATTIVTVE